MVWVGGDLKAHSAPTPAMGRAAPHQLRLPRAPSNLAMNTSRDGAPTACLGRVLQWLELIAYPVSLFQWGKDKF